MLAGLATCGVCGGGFVVEAGGKKRGRRPEYICHRHRTNGACSNALRIPVEDMNEAILQAVEEHALTPEAIEQVINLTERDDVDEQQATLSANRRTLRSASRGWSRPSRCGGDAASLVAKLRELEARQRAIAASKPRCGPCRAWPRPSSRSGWRNGGDYCAQSTTQGRTVLQRILRGRLTFTPRRNPVSVELDGYDFDGPDALRQAVQRASRSSGRRGFNGSRIGCEGIARRIHSTATTAACWRRRIRERGGAPGGI